MTPDQRARANSNKKRWADKNRDKTILYKRKHYHENRDKYLNIERAMAYKKLYGITLEDYDRMLKAQDGKCAICKSEGSIKGGKRQVFSVDHCHNTGIVRGLLCLACNHLLGRYEKHEAEIKRYLNK